MTDKEKMVMDKIIEKGSNFNFNRIDLSKPWDEQSFEGEKFWAFADVRDYGCGMSKQAVRGIFGSLHKKGLIEIWEDDDDRTNWIIIDEDNFEAIKKEYGIA